jgi:6-phosphofructokinase 1
MSRSPTAISSLGNATIASPLPLNGVTGDALGNFTPEDARIRHDLEIRADEAAETLSFEKAGPRARLFFDPARVKAAIVTCGGLCPGLNNVIRSAYRQLCNYGVHEVWGIRYGYRGLNPEAGLEPLRITDDLVDDIHRDGGTLLGSSRGSQPVDAMVAFLRQRGLNVLLTLGGDGTQRGAHELAAEAQRQGYPLAVVGIPKTIDNDIQYTMRTFGFASAVDQARDVLACAHAEARAYPNGVALVRLMGRDSGFIAAAATLASQEVNFTLIPEVPFRLEGPTGLLAHLERRLAAKAHALIAVAEGAGQDLLRDGVDERDASGNVLHKDIGHFLRDRILEHFRRRQIELNMKYIDPSYLIRSVPANSEDAVLCDMYARHAVHAALAGKTDLVIGYWNDFIHVPIAMATEQRRKVSPDSLLWNSVLSATGQPARMV